MSGTLEITMLSLAFSLVTLGVVLFLIEKVIR